MLAKQPVIAIAVSSLLALPSVAFAETGNVSIYGVANLSYELVSNGTGIAGTPAVTGAQNISKVSSNASRLGLKGTEDLGDGWAALWQIESLVAMDNVGGSFATRNTYAGLSNKRLGKILLGRNDTPYSTSSRGLDPFNHTIAESKPLIGGTAGVSAVVGFTTRQPDAILYVSPNLNGFGGAIEYTNRAENNTLPTQPKSSIWSTAGWYGDGTLYVSLAQVTHQLNSQTGARESAQKLALGYTPGHFRLGFVYEISNDNFSVSGTNQWGHQA